MLKMLSVLIRTMFLSLPTVQSLSALTFKGPLVGSLWDGVSSETLEVGSLIMVIEAVTSDRNSQISYELVENPGNYFALDKTTGNLTLALQPYLLYNILTVRASAINGKYNEWKKQ